MDLVVPTAIVILGLLLLRVRALVFWTPEHSADALMYATIPLVAPRSVRRTAAKKWCAAKGLAAGFLCAFWILAGAYLLFIGMFLFSSETRHPQWQMAWVRKSRYRALDGGRQRSVPESGWQFSFHRS